VLRVSVNLEELASVQGALTATTGQINRAAARSLNKTLSWAGGQGRRILAEESGLALKSLRSRVRIGKASRDTLRGSVWFGLAPVKAIYAGSARQTRTGVSARGLSYTGAFLATMPTGHLGIFKRRGPARLPIDEQRIYLAYTAEHLSSLGARAHERLRTIFGQEINYELRVRG
jgi:hypothetical protein